jgi:heterogeneous nuclear ribonucleoprotein F/H
MTLGEGDGQEQQAVDPAAVWGNVGMPAPIQVLSQQHYAGDAGQRRAGPMSGAMHAGRGSAAGRGGMEGGPPGAKRAGGGIQVGEHTGFLRMRGLPFTATKEDIAKFFEIYNPILDSIVLTYRSDGRATGEAYIGFETPENSKNAMDLHRKSMGTRYIELFLSNKEEHGRALTRFSGR